jgi:F0F1-type ATP synthase assembly protein I
MKNKSIIQIIIEITFIFLTSTLLLTFLGFLIDKKFKTYPIFIITFLTVGIILSLYLLYLYNKTL